MATHLCTCSPGELRPTGENHTQRRMLAYERSILRMNVGPHLKRKEERRQLNKGSSSGKKNHRRKGESRSTMERLFVTC